MGWRFEVTLKNIQCNHSIQTKATAKLTLKLFGPVNSSGLKLALVVFQSSPILSIYNKVGETPPIQNRK